MREHARRRHWALGMRQGRALGVHSGCGAVGVVGVHPLLLLRRGGQLDVGLRLEISRARRGGVGLGLEGPGTWCRGVRLRLDTPRTSGWGVEVVLRCLRGQRVRGEGRVRGAEKRRQSCGLGTGQ